jgi:hypothetical protein
MEADMYLTFVALSIQNSVAIHSSIENRTAPTLSLSWIA